MIFRYLKLNHGSSVHIILVGGWLESGVWCCGNITVIGKNMTRRMPWSLLVALGEGVGGSQGNGRRIG